MPNDNTDKLKDAKAAINARMLLLFAGIMLVFNAFMQTGRNGMGWLNMADSVEQYMAEHPEGSGAEPETEALLEAAAETPLTEAGAETAMEEAAQTEASSEIAEQSNAETELDIADLIGQMDAAGIEAKDLRLLGYGNLITAFFEIFCGLLCALYSNRVNRSKYTLGAAITVLVVEIVFMIFAFTKNALVITNLIYAVLLPVVLLWAALKMRKMAKADPERIYAVTPQQGRGGTGAGGRDGGQSASAGTGRNSAGTAGGAGRSLRERALMRAADNSEEETSDEQHI